MKTLRFILTTIVLTVASFATAAADSAAAILRAVAGRLASDGTVEALFSITGENGNMQGNLVLQGGLFTMSTPVFSIWYDGTTQWTLLQNTSEVSITEPTAEELMESNPFAILRNYDNRYRARRLSDLNGKRRVELTPLQGIETTISRAVISIDANNRPASVTVEFDSGQTLSAVIDHIAATQAKPLSAFRFSPELYPAFEIIDLR